MKKIYFAMSVAAAALLSASCAKEIIDSSENPSNVVAPGENDFVAVTEMVKSTMDNAGHQAWAAGDAIGITTADDANVQCAIKDVSSGTFDGEAVEGGSPFYAVYPYSADNTFTDGVLTATLPAVQVVPEGGNVDPRALVAACKSDSRTLQFNNCVALFQLTIHRADIKSVEIAATTADQYLAGQFTMALEGKNALTPAVVTGEGATPSQKVTLKAEGDGNLAPGIYYVAVLPGTVKNFKITFTNSANDKAVVSKTATVTLARNAGLKLGNFFEDYDIATADELINWAKNAPKSTKWDVVNLTADITLTPDQAASYVEAHEFRGVFNGNSKTITGLVTPLFGHLRGAYVHDLTLNSNLTLVAPQQTSGASAKNLKGSDYGVGLLAHYAYADEGQSIPKIKNVTTKGSLTINFSSSLNHNYNVGGLVGGENNVPMENCTNEVNINIEKYTSTAENLYVGGICGANQVGPNATLTDCTNKGNISVSSNVKLTSTASGNGYCSVAGISGRDTQPVAITRCSNIGSVTNSALQANLFFTAGICSRADGTEVIFVDCTNSGEILDNSSCDTEVEHHICGVVAYAGGKAATKSGNVITRYINLTNCVNTGNVTGEVKKCKLLRVSGICGFTNHHANIINCINGAPGQQTVIKASNPDGTTIYPTCYLGGISANPNKAGYFSGCKNYGLVRNECKSSSLLRLGGIVGNSNNTLDPAPEALYDGCINYGDVEDVSASAKEGRVGGIVGSSTNGKITIKNCENYGNLNSLSTIDDARLGGILGYAGNSSGSSLNSCISSATITGGTAGKCGLILGESIVETGYQLKDNRIAGRVNGTAVTSTNCQTVGVLYGAVKSGATVSGNTLYTGSN